MHKQPETPARATQRWVGALTLAATMLVGGCASGPRAHPSDPLEPLNRGVQSFNDGVDAAVLKPVATAYRDVVPSMVRTGVGNFFGNLRDLWSATNAALQLRPQPAVENFMRFSVNTVFGFLGVVDLASEMQIERTTLDFGHTLGRWGVPAGPYLVLPLLGPSSVRDTVGTVVDASVDPVADIHHRADRNAATVARVVDARSQLLRAGRLLDEAALDKYSFTRDAYLQRRAAQVRDARGEAETDLDPDIDSKTEPATRP